MQAGYLSSGAQGLAAWLTGAGTGDSLGKFGQVNLEDVLSV